MNPVRLFLKLGLMGVLCVAVSGPLVGDAGIAWAQTPGQLNDAQKEQVKDHYQKGRRLQEVGKYADAIDEYQKGYLIGENAEFLYNIAQCHRLLNNAQEALRSYKRFLAKDPGSSQRGEVEKRIAELEKQIDDSKKGVAPPPPTVAPPPPVPAPLPAPAPQPVAQPTAPPPAVVDAPPPAPVIGIAATAPSSDSAPRPSRVLPMTMLVGGSVLVATSFGLGLAAASKAKAVEDLAKGGMAFNPKLEKDGKALSGIAIGVGLVGLAAGVTGIIMLATSGSSSSAALPSHGSSNLAFFPAAGPDFTGAAARMTF